MEYSVLPELTTMKDPTSTTGPVAANGDRLHSNAPFVALNWKTDCVPATVTALLPSVTPIKRGLSSDPKSTLVHPVDS